MKTVNMDERYAHFIERQTGKAVRPYRADGYVNLLNKYGTQKDTSEHYTFTPESSVDDTTLIEFYEGNGLFAKIIDTPAEEAVKHGFEIEDLEDEKTENFLMESLDELDWEETAMTGIKWARLFGGAIAVLLVNDGRGIDEPLDWKNIQSIDDIVVYDRSIVQPDYQSMFRYDPHDPFSTRGSRLGMPERYTVNSRYGSFTVHDSRVLTFKNGILPENTTNSLYQMWGMPEYVRIQKAIRDSEIAHGTAVKMLDRSVQAIYKMRDLAAELSTEDGEERVLKRLETIDMARGLMNSITLDSDGEEYDFRTFQFTGVSEVVESTCNYLSAICSIPQTILFGRDPQGMNATGESDLENYYNYVERIQKRMLRGNLRYLLSIIAQAGMYTKEIDEVPPIKVKFKPLWSLSDLEQADLDLKKAQLENTKANTAQMYIDMQVLDPSEIRSKLAQDTEFDVEQILDEMSEEELEAGAKSIEERMQAMNGGGDMGGGDMGAMGNEQVEVPSPDGPTGNSPDAAPEATKLPQDKQGEKVTPQTPIEISDKEEITPQTPIEISDKEKITPQTPIEIADKKTSEKDDESHVSITPQAPIEISDGRVVKITPDTPIEIRDIRKAVHPALSGENPNSETTSGDGNYGSVGVLVVREGKILTGRRNSNSGYGLICGPGGHIEKDETPEIAAHRETIEEFGIRTLNLIPLGNGPKEVESGLTPNIFLCTEYAGEPHSIDGEMNDIQYMSMEELDALSASLYQPFADSLKILSDILVPKEDDRFVIGKGNPEQETDELGFPMLGKEYFDFGRPEAPTKEEISEKRKSVLRKLIHLARVMFLGDISEKEKVYEEIKKRNSNTQNGGAADEYDT